MAKVIRLYKQFRPSNYILDIVPNKDSMTFSGTVVITGKKTPLFNFLNSKNCAEIVTHDRNVNFTNSIRKLANDKELREEIGINGYNEILKNYSKNVVVSKYANLINSL